MFEDSLMESGHTNKAISKYWPFVSLLVNGGTLILILMWPLFHPEALPSRMITTLMQAPSPPPPPPPMATVSKVPIKSETLSNALQAPSTIPRQIKVANESAILPSLAVSGMEGLGHDMPGAMDSILGGGTKPVRVVKQTARTVSISSGLMAGNLLDKTLPQYPAIARAARIQGTVVLQATISGDGLIRNLRVISGPPMLQQAAVDAVRSWRYKPYLLNGEPVEVETTINVVFNLGQ